MPRTADRSLLPAALRARLDAGGVTNGEYHRLLPTFPDAALCDHAEVYAQHCSAASLPADPGVAEAYLHHFILPELVARLRGVRAEELSPPDPSSIFRRLLADWDAHVARVDAAIQEQRRLAGLPHDALAAAALRARDAVHCRWGPDDLVYDGSIHHTIVPELARRVAARGQPCAPPGRAGFLPSPAGSEAAPDAGAGRAPPRDGGCAPRVTSVVGHRPQPPRGSARETTRSAAREIRRPRRAVSGGGRPRIMAAAHDRRR